MCKKAIVFLLFSYGTSAAGSRATATANHRWSVAVGRFEQRRPVFLNHGKIVIGHWLSLQA
jgi:hypothetical protein